VQAFAGCPKHAAKRGLNGRRLCLSSSAKCVPYREGLLLPTSGFGCSECPQHNRLKLAPANRIQLVVWLIEAAPAMTLAGLVDYSCGCAHSGVIGFHCTHSLT
jgi:hypothetical protein